MEEHDYRHAGEARESGRDAQTLVQMNAPKPSANSLINETGLIKHDEDNPGKPVRLLRDSGRASFGPAEGSPEEGDSCITQLIQGLLTTIALHSIDL